MAILATGVVRDGGNHLDALTWHKVYCYHF